MADMVDSLSSEEKDMFYAYYLQHREDRKALIAQKQKIREQQTCHNVDQSLLDPDQSLRVSESEGIFNRAAVCNDMSNIADSQQNKSMSKLVIIPVEKEDDLGNNFDLQVVGSAPLFLNSDSDSDDDKLFAVPSETESICNRTSGDTEQLSTHEVAGNCSNLLEGDGVPSLELGEVSSENSDENEVMFRTSERKRSIECDTDGNYSPVFQHTGLTTDVEETFSQELEQLLMRGEISNREAKDMKQRLEEQKYLNEGHDFQVDGPIMSPFPFDTDGIPTNWTEHSNIKSSLYNLVKLLPGQYEYDHIKLEFDHSCLEVVKIERLQNLYLLDRFKSEMTDMKKRTADFELNIRYLFHGTNVDKSRICEEGLDQRLSRMGFFGKGIYFSDNPLKCVNYADNSDPRDEACILKCRVILGESKVYADGAYDTSLRREPEKEQPRRGWRYYDSVKGCPKEFNEYVVYENRRAMIEYIITFKADPSPRYNTTGSTSTADTTGSTFTAGTTGSTSTADTTGSTFTADTTGSTFTAGTTGSTSTADTTGSTFTADTTGSTFTAGTTGSTFTAGTTGSTFTAGTTGSTFTAGIISQQSLNSTPNMNTDEHFERIRFVREDVRRKRAHDRGEAYTHPTPEQIEQEKVFWNKLLNKQCMQMETSSNSGSLAEGRCHGTTIGGSGGATGPTERSNRDLREQLSPVVTASDGFLEDHPWELTEDEENPVDQVMNALIAEFQTLIITADSQTARSYIELAQMDVNSAIELYLDDFS